MQVHLLLTTFCFREHKTCIIPQFNSLIKSKTHNLNQPDISKSWSAATSGHIFSPVTRPLHYSFSTYVTASESNLAAFSLPRAYWTPTVLLDFDKPICLIIVLAVCIGLGKGKRRGSVWFIGGIVFRYRRGKLLLLLLLLTSQRIQCSFTPASFSSDELHSEFVSPPLAQLLWAGVNQTQVGTERGPNKRTICFLFGWEHDPTSITPNCRKNCYIFGLNQLQNQSVSWLFLRSSFTSMCSTGITLILTDGLGNTVQRHAQPLRDANILTWLVWLHFSLFQQTEKCNYARFLAFLFWNTWNEPQMWKRPELTLRNWAINN